MADTTNVKSVLKVIATTSDRVQDLSVDNGQLIFLKDVGRIAFDFNDIRVFYNQIVELETDAERLSLEAPLSGYYFVISTGILWYYRYSSVPSQYERSSPPRCNARILFRERYALKGTAWTCLVVVRSRSWNRNHLGLYLFLWRFVAVYRYDHRLAQHSFLCPSRLFQTLAMLVDR